MLVRNLGPHEDYQTAEIRIFPPPAEGEHYPVELKILGGPEFRGVLRVDHIGLNALTPDSQAYGRALGEALFADDVGRGYGEAIAAAQGQGGGLRVRLRLADQPELHGIRWERIQHPLAGEWHPLGVTAITPFSRYVPAEGWDRPLPVTERPLRVLAIVASPADLDRYSVDPIAGEERQAMHDTLDGLSDVAATYLETDTANRPTLDQIRRALARGYHVVHFMCHGVVTPSGSMLYLEDDAGDMDPIDTEQLVDSFRALAAPPLLCFLAACESATRGRHDAFVPLGPALVEGGGIHAVIAMTDLVGVSTAQLFASQFYARLLAHGVVDLAVNEARALVRDQWDWGVPVLFSRLPDNQLLTQLTGDAAPVIETEHFEPETIYIPSGPFLMGSQEGEGVPAYEIPQHEVDLPAYRIGKYPVTNEQYAEFIRQTGRMVAPEAGWEGQTPPDNKLNHPVAGVTWYDALAYCEWLSKQTKRDYTLPSEAQWEKAARGTDGRIYPWGDKWDASRCNHGSDQTTPVNAYPPQSPYGCYDMVGNVREWTSTLWGERLFEPDRKFRYLCANDPRGEDLTASSYVLRVYRGGAAADKVEKLRCSARNAYFPDKTGPRRKRHGLRVVLLFDKSKSGGDYCGPTKKKTQTRQERKRGKKRRGSLLGSP